MPRSKVKFCAKLEYARVPCGCNLPEVTVRKSRTYGIELCVIERIEALETKLKPAPACFTENEALE